MNYSVVQSIQAAIQALGPNFDPHILAATQDLYRPHIELGSEAMELNISYGQNSRHVLDIYRPAGSARAVVVFVHGGGFVGGDKSVDQTFYANIGHFLARSGFVAVLPNYRRAPEFTWPTGASDVQAALTWVRDNARSLMSGVLRMLVIGQSAGASHVASWLFDDHARGGERADVSGVLLMSGFYHAVEPLPDNIAAYFGTDVQAYPARSPLTHVKPLSVPICLSVAEFDPARIAVQTFQLAQALTVQNGRSPDFIWLRGHNHVSPVLSLGSPQSDVATTILQFLNR